MRNKRTYRLTENKLRGVIREAVKSVLAEGGQRYRFGSDNDSIEKKLSLYEKLVRQIIDSAERIITIVENSPQWNDETSVGDPLGENSLHWFASSVLKAANENLDLGEDGYDPTSYMTW